MDDSKNFEVAEFLQVAFKDTIGVSEPVSWKYMMKMLEDATHADVTFKAAGGEVVKAHRAILALFSPVFNTMFSCGMQEHRTSIVELADMDVEALQLFLVMLYSGVDGKNVKPNILEKHLKDVMAACHKFQVAQAIPILCAHMKRHLGIANCCHYYICADNFACQDDHVNMMWLGQTAQVCLNNIFNSISNCIFKHFDQVVRTDGFMYLAQTDHELTVRVVRKHVTTACRSRGTSGGRLQQGVRRGQLFEAIVHHMNHS